MLIAVFVDVLQSLNVEICVVNGEADNVIAGLANKYECPVLASDSDFFVFELEQGFIHFEQYFFGKMPDSLFNIRDFMKEFHLKNYELCLLIPALFGNDFIKTSKSTSIDEYEMFLANLAKHDFPEEYLANAKHSITSEKFKTAKELYRSRSFTG